MTARIVREADLVRVPWKNGGGTTAEVAAFPEGSTFDTFGWRISMADVSCDGPFSSFPQIDRTLIVTEGNGIVLDVDGMSYTLDATVPKLSFAGDDQTSGTLVAGPIRDLNIMTRRGIFTHRARIMQSGVTVLSDETAIAFLVPIDGALDITLGGHIHSLHKLDALVLDAAPDIIQISGDGRAVLIEIAPEHSA